MDKGMARMTAQLVEDAIRASCGEAETRMSPLEFVTDIGYSREWIMNGDSVEDGIGGPYWSSFSFRYLVESAGLEYQAVLDSIGRKWAGCHDSLMAILMTIGHQARQLPRGRPPKGINQRAYKLSPYQKKRIRDALVRTAQTIEESEKYYVQ